MRAAKIDANQNEIVNALRKAGCSVQILSSVGKGCPDLVVGFSGLNLFMEIKDGNKPKSAQKLTIDQVKWHQDWSGTFVVVNSIDQALQAISDYKQYVYSPY